MAHVGRTLAHLKATRIRSGGTDATPAHLSAPKQQYMNALQDLYYLTSGVEVWHKKEGGRSADFEVCQRCAKVRHRAGRRRRG